MICSWEGYDVADYLAQRIIDGAFDKQGGYSYVIGKRPDLKEGIDAYLTEKEHTDLIT